VSVQESSIWEEETGVAVTFMGTERTVPPGFPVTVAASMPPLSLLKLVMEVEMAKAKRATPMPAAKKG